MINLFLEDGVLVLINEFVVEHMVRRPSSK